MQIDFNLFGMGYVRLEDVFFRDALPNGFTKRQGWNEAEPVVHHETDTSGTDLTYAIFDTILDSQVYCVVC